jgi:hypothetical protein
MSLKDSLRVGARQLQVSVTFDVIICKILVNAKIQNPKKKYYFLCRSQNVGAILLIYLFL